MDARSSGVPASSSACFSRGSKGQTMARVSTSMASEVCSIASQFASMPRTRKKGRSAPISAARSSAEGRSDRSRSARNGA